MEVESEETEKEEAYRNSNGRLAAAIVITLFLVGGVPLMADLVGHGQEAERKPNFQSVRVHNRSHDSGYTRTAVGRMDEPTDQGDRLVFLAWFCMLCSFYLNHRTFG